MNETKFEAFAVAYRKGLKEAVELDMGKAPEKREYAYTVEQVPIVVEKMLKAMRENPRSVNYGGSKGFARTCKTLGIKHTMKAIFAYLEVV